MASLKISARALGFFALVSGAMTAAICLPQSGLADAYYNLGSFWRASRVASAPIAIYRSVGNTQAALATGTANGLSISGSTATFASALPNNVGVGDAIQYQVSGSWYIAFVAGRTSSTVYTLQSNAGAAPYTGSGVSGNLTWTIYRAYNSITQAISGQNQENPAINSNVVQFDNWPSNNDLVTPNVQWNIACYGDAVDTSNPVNNSYWNTSATNYLRIYTPYLSTEVGVSQRHTGIWTKGAYTLYPATSVDAFDNFVAFAVIDGLQIGVLNPADGAGMLANLIGTGDVTISNNIIRLDGAGDGSAMGVQTCYNCTSANVHAYNNLIMSTASTAGIGITIESPGAMSIYNNTIVGFRQGVRVGSGSATLYNNLIQGSTISSIATAAPGTITAADYNLTNDAGLGNTHDVPNAAPAFVNTTTYDYRLDSTDTVAKDKGVSLAADPVKPFATDLARIARPQGTAWDIGASEVVVSGDNETMARALAFSGITTTTYTATLPFTGDANANNSALIYCCDDTASPGCNPLLGSSSTMTRSGTQFTYNGSGTSGDTLNVQVVVTDGDGVSGATPAGTVTLTGSAITGFEYVNDYAIFTPLIPGPTYIQSYYNPPLIKSYGTNLMAVVTIGNNSTNLSQPHVYRYSSGVNDTSPAWTDTNGGNTIAPASTQQPNNPIYFSSYPLSAVEFAGNFYVSFLQYNGTNNVLYVMQYNGTTWSEVDPGSGGVNNSGTQAASSSLVVYNGKLTIAWCENSGTYWTVRVSQYQGGTTWSPIDGGALDYSATTDGRMPVLGVVGSTLVAAWNEGGYVRAKAFNGTAWSPADNGMGIDLIQGSYQSGTASMAALNNKLYIAYAFNDNSNAEIAALRVQVYGGGTTWTPVDGGTYPDYLNYFTGQKNAGVYDVPQLLVNQGNLYVGWYEKDPTYYSNSQDLYGYSSPFARLRVYNGNDSSPSWAIVGATAPDGLNYNPLSGGAGYTTVGLGTANNKLYATWVDQGGIYAAVFKENTTPTQLWFPDASNGGYNYDYTTVDCNAMVVRTADANGYVATAVSTVNVTLSGSGYEFYTDDNCVTALPSNQVTIASGTSDATFYFRFTSGQTPLTLSASASGLTTGTVAIDSSRGNPTLSNTWFWTGGADPLCTNTGGFGNWTNAHCWTAGTGGTNNGYPNAGYMNAYFFPSSCTVAPCSATVNANNIQVQDLWIGAGYSGAVTVASNYAFQINNLRIDGGTLNGGTGLITAQSEATMTGGTFNVGSGGFTDPNEYYQTGGTFNGGTGTITILDDFLLSGGTFNSTSGTFSRIIPGASQGSETFLVDNSATFNANGGTVNFGIYGGNYDLINAGNAQLYNVIFSQTTGGTLDIHSLNAVNLTISTGSSGVLRSTGGTGIISVSGNVTVSSGPSTENGGIQCSTLKLTGTGTQTVTGNATGTGFPCGMQIVSTGTVNLANTIAVQNWTYTSGTVAAGTSTVKFFTDYAAPAISSGTMHFNNATVAPTGSTSADIVGTLYVDGNAVIAADSTSNVGGSDAGNISVAGNLTLTQSHSGGTASITLTGGNAQTITRSAGTWPAGNFYISKTGGTTATLASSLALTAGQAFFVTSGNLDLAGFSVTGSPVFSAAAGTTVLAKGSETFTTQSTTFNATSTANYYGTASYLTTPGKLALGNNYGNLTFSGNAGSWKNSAATTVTGSLTIGTGATYKAGANTTVSGNWSNSGTYTDTAKTVILLSGASHAISGSTTFFNLTMDDSGNTAGDTLTFAAGSTTLVTGVMTLEGNSTNKLALRSSTPGTQWNINPSGGRSVAFADVQDSDNLNANFIDDTNNGHDSGNNVHWGFSFYTPALLQSTSVLAASCTTCASGALTATSANSLIVVVILNSSATISSGVTDNAPGGSNTYATGNTTITGAAAEIWYTIGANAGATAINVAYGAAQTPAIYVYEFSNINTVSPLDTGTTNSGTNTKAISAPLGTAWSREVVVSMAIGTSALTATGTFTASPVLVTKFGSSYTITSATGSYGETWNQASNGKWAEISTAFVAQLH